MFKEVYWTGELSLLLFLNKPLQGMAPTECPLGALLLAAETLLKPF